VKVVAAASACLAFSGERAAAVLGGDARSTHNWAGMVANSGTADGIDTLRGAVIVPRLLCGPSTSVVSVWIGFGGASGSMPQVGFHGTCEAGQASYAGFYEWYDPNHRHNASTLLPDSRLTMAEGDLVTMTVTAGPPGTDAWRGTILVAPSAGVGSHASFPIPRERGAASTVGRTAECIVERPGRLGGGVRHPLANFGTIHWTSCRVEKLGSQARVHARVGGGAWRQQDSGSYRGLTRFDVDRYSMKEGSHVLASAEASTLTTGDHKPGSVLTRGGFDVAWHAPGAGYASVLPQPRLAKPVRAPKISLSGHPISR
jgi:hypothetical protein